MLRSGPEPPLPDRIRISGNGDTSHKNRARHAESTGIAFGNLPKSGKSKVYPLRIEHGFEIHRAWIREQSNQFAWLIGYQGSENWEAEERAYYGSTERSGMKPNSARLIARSEEYSVEDIL